jgi:hypothetical protein
MVASRFDAARTAVPHYLDAPRRSSQPSQKLQLEKAAAETSAAVKVSQAKDAQAAGAASRTRAAEESKTARASAKAQQADVTRASNETAKASAAIRQQAEKAHATRPFVNAQGQKTGTRVNTTA